MLVDPNSRGLLLAAVMRPPYNPDAASVHQPAPVMLHGFS
jgi:hypothetical protein